jgi:cell division protein FtsQ
MARNGKYSFTKFLGILVWIILISGTVILLVAAIAKRNNECCTAVKISISGVQNNFFIDKKDVVAILEKTSGGKLEQRQVHAMDLSLMETELQKSMWVKHAELFFDNNNVLEVRITEREPIARIFTSTGASFYIDSSLTKLPLSDKFSPRLPVFTDFPSDAAVLSKADSNLLNDIKTMSEFINANPFWMAQSDQVDIGEQRTFDLIPKLGDQLIHFGNTEDYRQKFNNLLCFYKQVLTKIGWTHYSSISVEYKGQIVAVRKGAEEIKMDSLRSVQIMKSLIEDAQKHTNDSTNIQLKSNDDDDNNNADINSSHEVGNVPGEDIKSDTKGVSVIPIHVPEKPASVSNNMKKNEAVNHPSSIEKPAATLTEKNLKQKTPKDTVHENRKPKAVMPSKTDY